MFISDTGIEGLVHKTRPLLGVQFHPEVIQPEDPNPITAMQLLNYVMNCQTNEPMMSSKEQRVNT
jgi:anthranilate/para-aminobenzoate synthase component II